VANEMKLTGPVYDEMTMRPKRLNQERTLDHAAPVRVARGVILLWFYGHVGRTRLGFENASDTRSDQSGY